MLTRSQWLFTKYNFNFCGLNFLSFLLNYEARSLFLEDFFSNQPVPFCLLQKNSSYNVLLNFFIRNTRSVKFYQRALGFTWFRFVLFSGLGYKRRLLRKSKVMFSYIGDRHWILYKFGNFSLVGPNRRRNFIFFAFDKASFLHDYAFFSSLRKPYIYKMKGFLDARVRGRFLFVRRIKIRGVRTKLSKKQKLL